MPARDPRHDILFEPVAIGPKTLRNRFYQVPHCTGFGIDKPFSQAHFRAMKAEGGWAAVCTEYCSISPESDEEPYHSARLWDEQDVRSLALMTEMAHDHGALAGVELWHGGADSNQRESRAAAIAPSGLASEYDGVSVARTMTAADIRRTQQQWVDAALRARRAGFDIVYVYGGHGYLPGQFLAPGTNRRDDAYGGSLENRARFWLETLELVRAAVGDECAIAVRLCMDTLEHSGVTVDDGLAFVALADPLVDLWDVTVGSVADLRRLDSGPSRFFAQGYQLEWTARVREATAKPIVSVGRYTDPDLMADLVRAGTIDLIGAARPSISDPFLPSKIEQGRYDEIRECIGCNACYSRSVYGNHLGCTQNATAGDEYRRGWHPERFEPVAGGARDVLVVGAGPAGMECAIVLAKRGLRVHLAEAEAEIGGLMRWVPELPGLGEWGRVLNYRRIQLHKLRKRVELLTSTRLTAQHVLEYGADLVVIATGSRWALDGSNGITGTPIAGADAASPAMLTPEQIMLDGKPVPGERVAVIDCEGYFTGAGMAELLRGRGHEVDLITPFVQAAPVCDETLEGPRLRRHLHRLGVTVHRQVTVTGIAGDHLEGLGEHDQPWQLEADAVVLVTQRMPQDALYLELIADPARLGSEGIQAVHRAGDCVAPRLLADAIFDGHRMGREIDSADPAVPLPYLRERATV